jgi:predicted CoA-binding protein
MSKEKNTLTTVAIIGASNKEDRYSYMAFKMLNEYGYYTVLVHPVLESIENNQVFKSLQSCKIPIDTVTMYVNPINGKKYMEDILAVNPRRVIFNPGTESDEMEAILQSHGIMTLRACTLVMLRTGQFY